MYMSRATKKAEALRHFKVDSLENIQLFIAVWICVQAQNYRVFHKT